MANSVLRSRQIEMDKRQAAAIADAILKRDGTMKSKREEAFDHDKYSKLHRGLVVLLLIFVVANITNPDRFLSVKTRSIFGYAEWTVVAVVFVGSTFIAWRRFHAAQLRRRLNRDCLEQELAAHK
ncbi:MAG: hypothetical protein ACRETQ_07815 [Gammaproteobacteria bacterium]